MLLWLTHTTGIRVTGLALLEVADIMYPSNAIKPEVYLRADITKGCRPRNIYLTHPKCIAALEAWFAVRHRRLWGLSGEDEYRGFRPSSKLVMTHKGQAFEMAFKHRELESGAEVYRACDSLQQTISRSGLLDGIFNLDLAFRVRRCNDNACFAVAETGIGINFERITVSFIRPVPLLAGNVVRPSCIKILGEDAQGTLVARVLEPTLNYVR